MSVEIRQLKDHNTNLPFVPVTQWDAVSNKPTIPSKTSQLTNDSNFAKVVTLTRAQYEALSTKDPKTLYIITD